MIQAEPITAKELFESMVEVPVDNTCRTCRFWERFAQWYGQCFNGDETGVFTLDVGGVFYPETFGCRFHQPKEAQNDN
jgi:hypothetical protein